MLEKLNSPGFEKQSKPCKEAIVIAERVKQAVGTPVFAEIGVGIGATTIELVHILNGNGEIHLFDSVEKVTELVSDLRADNLLNGINVTVHAYSKRLYSSYAWELARWLVKKDAEGLPRASFDFVYLHGHHLFHHDAVTCAMLKETTKKGGYIVIDDVNWTIASSPSLNPKTNPSIRKQYSDDQIDTPHISFILDLFLNNDPQFERVFIDNREHAYRAIYRKIGA